MTLHKYLYADINPVNNIDPSGKFSLTELAITMSVAGTINAGLTYAFSGGNATIAELGKSFRVGAVLAPVGGALTALAGPLIRSMATPLIQAVGRMDRITLLGRAGWEKALVKMSRYLLNTNKNYPPVGSTFFGSLLKKILPNVEWQQHHVFIQQAWFRVGSPNQLFEDLVVNRGLQRNGNGL